MAAAESVVIDPKTGCLEFTRGNGSYGTVNFYGRPKSWHKAMFEKLTGVTVPNGLQLDHRCENKRCGNPDHLEIATPRANTLRSSGPTAKNARKTRCPAGHEFVPENLYPNKAGRRVCKPCKQTEARDRQRRKRAN